MATMNIDTRGQSCPLPILNAKKAIRTLSPGDTLEVLATDPGAIADFEAFARSTGNELTESSQSEGVYRFLITVGGR